LASSKDQFVTPGDKAADQALWTEFWQDFAADNEAQERCHIPGDGRELVDLHWRHLARELPIGARVVDLGCGAGILGRTLLHERGDLIVDGIDLAQVPQPPVPNLTIHRWVSMESLPFEQHCFDAAVSLYGIEYGNLAATTSELQRVLKSGAKFSFLIHHSDSEIAREGSTRRRALRQLMGGKMKAGFLAGSRDRFLQQCKVISAEFPGEPTVRLVTRRLAEKLALLRAEREAIWHDFVTALSPEAALLARLERAAKSSAGLAAWLEPLIATMQQVSVAVMRRRSNEPIAWKVSGIR
jgi:SAM-dependent methyltransferase